MRALLLFWEIPERLRVYNLGMTEKEYAEYSAISWKLLGRDKFSKEEKATLRKLELALTDLQPVDAQRAGETRTDRVILTGRMNLQ